MRASILAVLLLCASSRTQAAELTIAEPETITNAKGGSNPQVIRKTLHLGEALAITATGRQALAILDEVDKGTGNRRLTLYLDGIDIPGLHSSFQVTEATAKAKAGLERATGEADKAEKAAKEAQARADDPKIADTNKQKDADEKKEAARQAKAALATAQSAFETVPPEVAVRFVVDRNSESADSRKAWDAVLRGKPNRLMHLSVALAVGSQSPVEVDTSPDTNGVPFVVSDHITCGYVAGVFMALLCLALVGWKSQMLREGGNPDNAFSLGRVQMAFWGLVVLSSFVGVAVACRSLEHIPAQVLVLLGISATTGLSAAVMDHGAQPTPKSKAPWGAAFFEDICVGDAGASFHRVQVVLWTLVLGIYFVLNVCQMMSMPEFSETLLVLMGISNGTYLGFKTQEKGPALAALQMSNGQINTHVSGGKPPYKWKLSGGAAAGIADVAPTSLAAPGPLIIPIAAPTADSTLTLTVTDAANASATQTLDVKRAQA